MPKMGIKTGKNKAITEFFQKNKSLAVLLPVLVIGIIVIIAVYSKPGNQVKPISSNTNPNTIDSIKTNNDAGLVGSTVEILPQMQRITKPEGLKNAEIKDPFALKTGAQVIVLKGIAYNGDSSTAIIETENRAYVVSAGDKVGERWNVVKVNQQSVVLEDGEGNALTLDF